MTQLEQTKPIQTNQVDYQDLPVDWQQWLADCIMMQVPEQTLITYLVNQGIEPDVAVAVIVQMKHHPFIAAGLRIARQMKRRDWLLNLYHNMDAQSGYMNDIERVESLDRQTFYKHYKACNRPVIMTRQIADWEVLKRWTPEYFKQAYGDRAIQVQHLDHDLVQRDTHLTMGRYIDEITKPDAHNGWYMTIRDIPYNAKTIDDLYSQIDRLPELLDPQGKDPNGYLLLGPKGTVTDLHFDLANALYCQIYGRKHFKIIAPYDMPYVYPVKNYLSQVDLEHYDPTRWPLFEQAKVYDVVLEPGEVLFLPVGWWHYVVALDTSISASFSNFYDRDRYRQYHDLYGPELVHQMSNT